MESLNERDKTVTESISSSQVIQRSPRPIGVWILTIYILIFAGIAPFLLSVFMLFSGNAAGNEFGILLSLPVSIGLLQVQLVHGKATTKRENFC